MTSSPAEEFAALLAVDANSTDPEAAPEPPQPRAPRPDPSQGHGATAPQNGTQALIDALNAASPTYWRHSSPGPAGTTQNF